LRTDVRLAEGFAAVHAGIRAAAPIVPSPENIAEFQRNQAQRNEIERIKATYPLPNGLTARLEYRARESGEIWIHKFIKAEEDEETGERNETWLPICSPMSPTLRLHMLDDDDLYGLRVHLADMENHPRAVDFHRGELGRLAASEIRSRLLGAGLRVANGGEITIVEILKEARPEGDSRPIFRGRKPMINPPFVGLFANCLIQQRREAVEHVPMILRRLTELERVIGGGDMHVPTRHTRRRPLGVDT
jgi:hypothetical protein